MNQKISYRACLSDSVVVNLQRKEESKSLFFFCLFLFLFLSWVLVGGH